MEKKRLPPQTWRNFPIQQQPNWPCSIELQNTINSLRKFPPLVSPIEVLKCRKELAGIANDGLGFVLHGGDCAERFADCCPEIIENKIRLLLQLAGIIRHSLGQKCVLIARIAGQYAKPRSTNPKTEDQTKVFRGDNVHEFNTSNRQPNPHRLIQGYFDSSAKLNYIRTLMSEGFQDIPNFPSFWDVKDILKSEDTHLENILATFLKQVTENAAKYRLIKQNEDHNQGLHISHEALVLDYEDAMTRFVDGKYYNLSAPFIWIGDRTRQLDHAHIEYIRRIENPIGIKVGPSMEAEELITLLKRIWPKSDQTPGKVTLITRFGVDKVELLLPKLIQAVQLAGYKVIWSCDPCHGNSWVSPITGFRTRNFKDILAEIQKCIELHDVYGSRLSGIHIECTGEDVTECIGGCQQLAEDDLIKRYESYCDPRLNYSQSMELALLIGGILANTSNGITNLLN